MSKWSEPDLEARLCRALDLARRALECFAADGYTDRESPVHDFGPEKLVAETAMLLYAASSSGDRPKVARRIDELARALVSHARSEPVLVDIALHPALAFKFAVPHVLLTRMGYPDAGFDDFLRTCIASQARNGHDRSSCASVERRWISSLFATEDARAGWRAALLDSLLNWPLDIRGGLREDVYAFTHLIFYCTDFGFQARRLPRRRSIILDEASSALARYLDAEDYDLAGELLLAWPLTGAAWTPSAAFGFRVLARVEDQVGLLPCGNVNTKRLTELQGEERSRYALAMAYHTAYVMGFLCAASLRPGRIPPARIGGTRIEQTCLRRLLAYIADDQGHWQSEFSTLAEEERQALTPFILDAAIIQNCRKRDYAAVREIISLACEYRIASSPACAQAVELLQRIAKCSIAIGLARNAKLEESSSASPPVATALLQVPG